MDRNDYNDSAIDIIDIDIDRVKKKYGVYIGYGGTPGFMHLIKEIMQNCIDETKVKGGTCDEILVDYCERSKRVTIIDNGRGIPHGKLIACATILHSSGKFSKGGKNAYDIAAGTNGVGLTCTNALSYVCEIISYRDGVKYSVSFEMGEVKNEKKESCPKNKNGTVVSFIPNEDVIGNVDLTVDLALNLFDTMGYLSAVRTKVHITKKNDKVIDKVIYHKNGIADLLDDILVSKPLIKPIRIKAEVEDKNVDIIMTYVSDLKNGLNVTNNGKSFMLSYANFCTTIEGGTHVKGFYQGITKTMTKCIKESYFTKKDKDLILTQDDITDGLVVILNLGHIDAKFVGQIKEKLENVDCVNFVRDAVNKGLNKWFKEESKDGEKLGKYIKEMAKIRIKNSADKKAVIREVDVKNSLSGEAPKGFTPASGTEGLELWIVEGSSAAGSMKQGRDKTYQEIFELRGVTKNTLEEPLTKILENNEIRGLMEVIGTNIGRKFDITKCRYNHIVIATDADADGGKISSGLATFFHEHMYELVETGIIVKVVPPLYKIKKGKKEIYINSTSDYASYIRKEVSNNIEVYHLNKDKKGDILKPKEVEKLIGDSFLYARELTKYSKRLVCNKKLLEICAVSYKDLNNNKLDKFRKQLKELSEFMKIEKTKKGISLTGLIDKEYQHVELNKSNMVYINKLNYSIETNLNNETKYYIDGAGVVLLCELIEMFKTYEPKHKQRYKGLGEMNATQLWETTMDPENRTVIRLTTSNKEKEMEQLRVLHSEKEKYRNERKKLMTKFKIDRDEIDT